MSLALSNPRAPTSAPPRIFVVGVGGAGRNAVNNMIRSNLEGVEFIVADTEARALDQSICDRRIQLGVNVTMGLGAGSRPDVGRAAAEETIDELTAELDGGDMMFLTAGMGGGTGTGAAPVIARAARERGIMVVGVVTTPFHFEGAHRMRIAETGIQELRPYVDTLIAIPKQNLFRVANETTTFADAFAMADQVLYSAVRCVTGVMFVPGLISLDFADVRSILLEMGNAVVGIGEAEGETRAVAAAEAAIFSSLLDAVSMKGARGVLINITGGFDMTLFEVDEAANRIRDEVDPEANIIFGSTFDKSLGGKIRILVVATGIEAESETYVRPTLTLIAKGGQLVGARRSTSLHSEAHPTPLLHSDRIGITPAPSSVSIPVPPRPPKDLHARDLRLLDLAADTVLYRLHQNHHHALHFGHTGGNRFDAPKGEFGVLYLGQTIEAAFAETLLREPGRTLLAVADIAARTLSVVHSSRRLRLVRVAGHGLARIGATAVLSSGSYDVSQEWSLALWSHPQQPDGLLYRARHDDDQLCVALFDRTESALSARAIGPLTGDPRRLAWLLDRYGVGLV